MILRTCCWIAPRRSRNLVTSARASWPASVSGTASFILSLLDGLQQEVLRGFEMGCDRERIEQVAATRGAVAKHAGRECGAEVRRCLIVNIEREQHAVLAQ